MYLLVKNVNKEEAKKETKSNTRNSKKKIIIMSYIPRLKNEFEKVVSKSLMNEFSYKSTMQVPRVIKIILSRGVGEELLTKNSLNRQLMNLHLISGQKQFQLFQKKMLLPSS